MSKKKPKVKKKLAMIAIDPGIEFGWAFFPKGEDFPTACGVYTPRKSKLAGLRSFEDRAAQCIDHAENTAAIHGANRAVIEWPKYFNTAEGQVAAASESLTKLAFITGALATAAMYGWADEFELIPVNTWKGQMKKPLVIERIKEAVPASVLRKLKVNSHAWDAIGIGLFDRGVAFDG